MTDQVEQIRQWAKDAHERYGTIGLCPYRHGKASAEEETAEKSHAAAAVVVAAGNRAERDIQAAGEVASYEAYFVKGAVQLLAALWTHCHSRRVTGSLMGRPRLAATHRRSGGSPELALLNPDHCAPQPGFLAPASWRVGSGTTSPCQSVLARRERASLRSRPPCRVDEVSRQVSTPRFV